MDDWIYAEVGRLIRQRRRQLELTQEQLASVVGLSRTSLANIENGRQKVLVHHLFAFASSLGMEPAELLPRATSRLVTRDEVKFPKHLSAHHRSQLATLIDEPLPKPSEGQTNASPNKR